MVEATRKVVMVAPIEGPPSAEKLAMQSAPVEPRPRSVRDNKGVGVLASTRCGCKECVGRDIERERELAVGDIEGHRTSATGRNCQDGGMGISIKVKEDCSRGVRVVGR